MGPWAFGVPITLVSALGLLLNAYILLVVVLTKQTQQTANTLLLVHLGAVEAALCVVAVVLTTGGWPHSGAPCALHGFLLTLLHPVALWTVTGLNCDRYYAIAAPLHYTALVSPRRVAAGLGASWIGALILCLLPLSGIVPPYRYSPGLGCCAPDFGSEDWGAAATWYGVAYASLGLAVPAALVTICNLRVLSIARYHRHRIASAIYEVTLSAQVTITHQRNPFSFVPTVTAPAAGGPPRFHSAATTVVQLVGSLYLLYFPYCGLVMWEACGTTRSEPLLSSIAALLLACASPVNGLLYGLKSRTLRRSMQNYWRKKATKSELQQEIQARTPSVAGSRRASVNASSALFSYPPLQRRLSEALLGLGSSRSGTVIGNPNSSSSLQLSRLHPAASCNTLRVPCSESGPVVRASASAASLTGSRYPNTGSGTALSKTAYPPDTPRRSPRILITRAYSEEGQDSGSPRPRRSFAGSGTAPLLDKRRWRQRSTGSESSTGSSEGGIWTTGVAPRVTRSNGNNRNATTVETWSVGRRLTRGRTLEEGAIFSAALTGNNSESSDTTDTTATTTTSTFLTKTPAIPFHEKLQSSEKLTEKRLSDEEEEEPAEKEASGSDSSWCSVEEDENEDHRVHRRRSKGELRALRGETQSKLLEESQESQIRPLLSQR